MDLRFRAAVETARQSDGLYFSGLLEEQRILQAMQQASAMLQAASTHRL